MVVGCRCNVTEKSNYVMPYSHYIKLLTRSSRNDMLRLKTIKNLLYSFLVFVILLITELSDYVIFDHLERLCK